VEARIIGLKGCGKTTLLDALSEGRAGGSGVAAVKVVDPRVRELSAIFQPKKTTFAEFRTREAEWPRREGRKGEMAGYIDALQGAQVFLHVVRGFENPMLGEAVHAEADLATLDTEFVMADLITIERAFERARKQKLDPQVERALAACRGALESETPLRDAGLALDDLDRLRGYGFATLVPQVVLLNVPSGESVDPLDWSGALAGREFVAFPFPDAREVAELSPEEQMTFAEALGLPGPAAEVVTRAVFDEMGLISFFTVGPDEVRAWPIPRGWNAQRSAGTIHSDLERGFIRAETVSYEDFLAQGDLKKCRDAGTLRLEGKEYVVADGDIINVRFNV